MSVFTGQTTAWTAQHMAALDSSRIDTIPLVTAHDLSDPLPGFHLWDMWTVETPDGRAVDLAGWTPWVIMCAPRDLHPDLRHDVARLRLMLEHGGDWRDCGYLLPDDLNPGSREWAGSSLLDPETGRFTLFYTVTGRRDETARNFEQRLFQTCGQLDVSGDTPRVTGWSEPAESVEADGTGYVRVGQGVGEPGFIKAFRDPFHFRDPADGAHYLAFTASLAASDCAFNGVIGLARATGPELADWELCAPLLSADCLNNEMERPVLRHHGGRYYAFWSTQRRTFAPGVPNGPNGLYGMVADRLAGPWRPINGCGLVVANPDAEPFQTYSWWVTDNLEVAGFVDHWGLAGRSLDAQPDLVVRQFGGVPAPRFRLALDGDSARIAK